MTSTASSDGGPAGSSARARKELRRPVLHRAEHVAVGVVVHGAPRPPLRLCLLDPLRLSSFRPVARLPPDAVVTDARRILKVTPVRPGDARPAHCRPDLVDDHVDRVRLDVRHLLEVRGDAPLHFPSDLGDRCAPLHREMQLHAHAPRLRRRCARPCAWEARCPRARALLRPRAPHPRHSWRGCRSRSSPSSSTGV